jgi:hypothetical protein
LPPDNADDEGHDLTGGNIISIIILNIEKNPKLKLVIKSAIIQIKITGENKINKKIIKGI